MAHLYSAIDADIRCDGEISLPRDRQ